MRCGELVRVKEFAPEELADERFGRRGGRFGGGVDDEDAVVKGPRGESAELEVRRQLRRCEELRSANSYLWMQKDSLLAGSNAAGDVLGFSNSATRFSFRINSSNTTNALVSPPLTSPSATIPSSSIIGTAKSPLGPLKLS